MIMNDENNKQTEISPASNFAKLDDFQKIKLKVGTVVLAEAIEGSEKLIKLLVDLGEEKRQVLAGIKKYYDPATLVGTQIVIVANLEPRKMMGLESQGMIVAAHGGEGEAILLRPEKPVPNGSAIN
jgi:methionyl-tRNA synthetase